MYTQGSWWTGSRSHLGTSAGYICLVLLEDIVAGMKWTSWPTDIAAVERATFNRLDIGR